jgi:hypothetical protein
MDVGYEKGAIPVRGVVGRHDVAVTWGVMRRLCLTRIAVR